MEHGLWKRVSNSGFEGKSNYSFAKPDAQLTVVRRKLTMVSRKQETQEGNCSRENRREKSHHMFTIHIVENCLNWAKQSVHLKFNIE